MKTFCPSCERETNCVYVAELYECKECGCDFESRQRLMQERAEAAEARADALQADKKRIEAQLSVMSAAVCMIAGNHPDLFTGEVQSASLTIARTFAPWVKKGGEK